MDSKLVFPVALLVLMCLIDTGSSIKCHVCNSYEHGRLCADPQTHEDGKPVRTDDQLVECGNENDPAGRDYFCRKIYQNVRGDERIIRSCGYVKDEGKDRDCYTTVLEEYNTLVCQCNNEDGCNSGNMYKLSSFAVLSAILLAYLIH